jgi:starvation-inducible DNA-binding protein
MRDRIEATEDDEVTQDLIIEITGELEKHWWMWQAEAATD